MKEERKCSYRLCVSVREYESTKYIYRNTTVFSIRRDDVALNGNEKRNERRQLFNEKWNYYIFIFIIMLMHDKMYLHIVRRSHRVHRSTRSLLARSLADMRQLKPYEWLDAGYKTVIIMFDWKQSRKSLLISILFLLLCDERFCACASQLFFWILIKLSDRWIEEGVRWSKWCFTIHTNYKWNTIWFVQIKSFYFSFLCIYAFFSLSLSLSIQG